MPAKRKNTRKQTNSKKKANPSLNLVLKRLDKIDQRFDAIDQRFDAVDRKVDAVDQKVDAIRQETAAEFKAVRGEMAQGLEAVRGEMAQGFEAVRGEMAQGFEAVHGEMAQGFEAVHGEMAQGFEAVHGEMAQGFDLLRREFKAELQKEFEAYGAKTYPIYTRLENKVEALDEKFTVQHNQLLTAMDTSAKNYEQFDHDSAIINAEHRDLKKDVEALKKRDMEKAAAIENIEKEIDKLKAA